MRAIRKKRLYLVLFIFFGAALAVTLVLFALNENLNHFYTPTQIASGEAPESQKLRAGGLVVAGSVERSTQDLAVEFVITDTAESVRVAFTGILPDLFREGQGIIAIGEIDQYGVVQADEILAKHDENYMSPEVKKAIEAAGHPVDEEYPEAGY